jgi:large subunit ribosomal protein L10
MFVRGINAPISGLVNVLSGSIRNFINVLNSIKDEKS